MLLALFVTAAFIGVVASTAAANAGTYTVAVGGSMAPDQHPFTYTSTSLTLATSSGPFLTCSGISGAGHIDSGSGVDGHLVFDTMTSTCPGGWSLHQVGTWVYHPSTHPQPRP